MLSILFGLGAALGWGAGDFTGGLASRKTGAYRAVFYASVIGAVFILAVALFSGEPLPEKYSIIMAGIAGMAGALGLLLLYQSMTLGLMSIAAPVSALLAAVLPVIVSMFTEGLPKFTTILGFGFALFAVWMVSQGENGVTNIFTHLSDLRLPLLAGIGFGSYFIVMHEATRVSTLWPMVFSRSAGILLIGMVLLFRRESWKVTSGAWTMIALNGILDVTGNIFFILAGQSGRLDVASVLSSLFPGTTVVLAWIFLKERLNRSQWIGIGSALIAIILMTI